MWEHEVWVWERMQPGAALRWRVVRGSNLSVHCAHEGVLLVSLLSRHLMTVSLGVLCLLFSY